MENPNKWIVNPNKLDGEKLKIKKLQIEMGLRAVTILLLIKAAIIAVFAAAALWSSGVTIDFIIMCAFMTFLVILALFYEICARCMGPDDAYV